MGGWVAGREPQIKVAGMRKGYVFTKNSQTTSIGDILISTSLKAAKSIANANSKTSHVHGDSQSPICFPRENGAI